jgi:TrmH family RNA methyltransferase
MTDEDLRRWRELAPTTVLLDGFHALKHALRFGAEILRVEGDRAEVETLAAQLAPDLRLPEIAPGDEIVAIARPPRYELDSALARPGPVVYLEAPRRLGNLGAAIRVAAAAGAAAVLTTADPWHPVAIRGAAGLQFALPVLRVEHPPAGRRLVAIDPAGDEKAVDRNAMLAFGSARHGLTDELLARADERVRIPMRPGVSSLNLATAVAAVLYGAIRD